MSNDHALSQSRLGSYAHCPQHYQYDYVYDISTPDDPERYRQRGIALHRTLERLCEFVSQESEGHPADSTDVGAKEIREEAQRLFTKEWGDTVDSDEYRSDPHYEYDRQRCAAGIETYLSEDRNGIDHVRGSVATEKQISFEHNGLALTGYIDNIVKQEDAIILIDYKTTLSRVISGQAWRAKDYIEEHLEEEKRRPKDIGSIIQAAIYTEGIRYVADIDEIDFETEDYDIRFVFYGIIEDTDTRGSADGVTPVVEGDLRDVTDVLEQHGDKVWQLIERYHQGIRTEQFDPEPWEVINEDVCEGCRYNGMCDAYLGAEVNRLE